MLKAWYIFSEVKQTYLGFSIEGNSGRGLGKSFASHLHTVLQNQFKDFGKEDITKSSHLEKLCLISEKVGKDKISDFTTNFTKKYLLQYTSNFAEKYLDNNQCKKFNVPRVVFDYNTMVWRPEEYILPYFNNSFVLLTPRDLLTRDNTFINRMDMIRNLENIALSVDNDVIRFQLNNYFRNVLSKNNKEMPQKDKDKEAMSLIMENPELIDYYIKYKEDKEQEATSLSQQLVEEATLLLNTQLRSLINLLYEKTDFYKTDINSYDEAYKRALFLKSVIEDMDGYKLFYIDGKPVRRENDLQIMYRLVWFASEMDVNREVNNGRGPVDFKISRGTSNSTLVEFKLASNSKLKQNLANQVEIYKKANMTKQEIKIILYFTNEEYIKVISVLKELKLQDCKDIILINATPNKPSASNVKT